MGCVYAYNLILVTIGPEKRGRDMHVTAEDETVDVVGKIFVHDEEGDHIETIGEKTDYQGKAATERRDVV